MTERHADVGGGIRLCFETFGDAGRPTVLLVMGLGTQMIAWHEDFCRMLVDRGFHVVRFDNRDVGRSTQLRGISPPTPLQLLVRRTDPRQYPLADMAGDAVGLLDHLGADSAHVVGASMGGMIAQTVAARHPARVRSLVSIMSTTGSRRAGQPALRMYPVLLRRPPRDPGAFVEHTVRLYRAIGSPPDLRGPEEELRRMARRAWERGIHPAGTGRQLGAVIVSGDRTAELRRISAPTLVIHGTADRLVPPSGGRATARAVPGARLLEIDRMGHDLPRGLWPRLVESIAGHARAADEDRLGAAA